MLNYDKLKGMVKKPKSDAAANSLGGLSKRVVDAKKKRKKQLEDAAKGL